ncbi:MAG: glycosyltransferase family 87 protein [Actinomycetota bacterium]
MFRVRHWLGSPASLGVALAATAIGLLLAYLLKEQCVVNGWADNFQYRHLCYNDIQPLFHVRGIDRNLIPYRDIQVEYPVLIGSFMYFAGRVLALAVRVGVASSYNDPQYFTVTAALLAPLSFAVTLLLRKRVPAGRLLLWALGTPTILYSFLNWDLLAAAALVWGLVEVERRHWGWAGIALAVGASAKLYPAFVMPCALLAVLAAGDRRGAKRLVAGFLGATALINVPWMVAAFSRWMGIWRFHATRYPDFGTMWYWIAQWGNNHFPRAWWLTNVGGYGTFVGNAGLVAFGVLSLVIIWVGWRRRKEDQGYPVAAISLALLATFLVVSKVHSPQYALWVAPLLVLVDIPWWQIAGYLAADLVLFVSGFYWFTEFNARGTPGWERLFVYAVFARALFLILVAVRAGRKGRRQLATLAQVAPPSPAEPEAALL